MEVTYDDAKDAENITKHGISLVRANDFDFNAARWELDNSQDYGEERWNLVSWLDASFTILLSSFIRSRPAPSVCARQPSRRENNMPKSKQPIVDEEYGVPDADSPEWTAERFARSIGFNELSEQMRRTFSAIQETSMKRRGLQKAPTKQSVTIRLSPDVLVALRGKGRGWQTLVDQTLREKFLNAKA